MYGNAGDHIHLKVTFFDQRNQEQMNNHILMSAAASLLKMRFFLPSFFIFMGVSLVGITQIYFFGLRHDANLNVLAALASTHAAPCPSTSTATFLNAKAPNDLIILDSMVSTISDALFEFQSQRKRQGRKATFLQIGANDGVTYDQLYPTLQHQKSDWIGLMVEPQPILYSKLVVLHADARDWSFYQGVVIPSCQNGTIVFCETSTPGQGNFKTQGQLNGVKSQDECEKHPGMVQVPRPCAASYDHLLEKGNAAFAAATHHSDSHWVLDVLQIDTEGKDFDLIQMISSELLFTCINFEHTFMGSPERRPAYNTTMEKLSTVMNDEQSKMEYIRGKGDTLACRVRK